MPISTLRLTNLGPIDDAEFEFDAHINVFVGPNNCGKSTSLIALGDISVFPFGVPSKLLRKNAATFRVCFSLRRQAQRQAAGKFPISCGTPGWAREKWQRLEKDRKRLGYTAFVPALRWSTDYRSQGPMQKRAKKNDRSIEQLIRRKRHNTRELREEDDTRASIIHDEQIVQQIVDLDYRSYRLKRPAMRTILNDIASLASQITEGYRIEFAGIGEDKRGLFPEFETPDGKMPLDVLSQGTQSLIQWLAQLFIGYAKYYKFPVSLNNKPGILIIDEIDAHLHPSWQRRILPALARQFPSLQVFCSTHSPLMLAGLKAGQIQLLTRDSKGKITVSRNESDIIGWSADEILTSFLGVDNATDLGSEENLQRLQELRGKKRLTSQQREQLESLRDSMNQRLLAGPASEELAQLAHAANRPGKNIRKKSARKATRAHETTAVSRTSKPKRKSTKVKN